MNIALDQRQLWLLITQIFVSIDVKTENNDNKLAKWILTFSV
jgi:hypothetical protein